MVDVWGESWLASWGNSWRESAPAPVVVAVPAVDKGAGSGRRKQWWEGEWIIPGVTHYLPEKPPDDIVPLRPVVESLGERLAKSQSFVFAETDKELPGLKLELASLARSTALLEKKALTIEAAVDIERSIRAITERYRLLSAKARVTEGHIVAHEKRVAHLSLVAKDDEDFIRMLDSI